MAEPKPIADPTKVADPEQQVPPKQQTDPKQIPEVVYLSFSAEVNVSTTEILLAAATQFATRGVKTINLLLSTAGGQVTSGITLYNTLRALPIKLITHNMGSVNSVGNVVFLAGEERYSSQNATFMFHGVGFEVPSQTRFEQKNLRERLDSLIADEKKLGEIIADRTSLTPQEVNQLFLEAVTKDANYARSKGIIDEIRDVQIPPGSAVQQLVFKR